MVDRNRLLFHLRATRFDAGIVAATALAAVVVSVEFCILIGVFLSFVLYVPRAAHVHLTELTVTPDATVDRRPSCSRACGPSITSLRIATRSYHPPGRRRPTFRRQKNFHSSLCNAFCREIC